MTKQVLAIDDDKFVHVVIEQALAGFCQLTHATSGEQGLLYASEYKPDIILLDVGMPDMSGFDVCKKIKENDELKDIPVMFLSGNAALPERVAGYNVGAEDYIVKPFNAEELMARIQVLYRYREQSKRLASDVEKAQVTAEIAMNDSGDMGRMMRYVGQSYHAHDLDSLSNYFFEFFRPLLLDVVVAFWYQDKAVFYSIEGANCPLAQDLLTQHQNSGRFIDFEQNTIVNYPKVSLLIKNMPLDNEALYGRYKDLFPHILEVTNAKLEDMEVNEQALSQAQKIGNSFNDLTEVMLMNTMRFEAYIAQLNQQIATLAELIASESSFCEKSKLSAQLTSVQQTQQDLTNFNHELVNANAQLQTIIDARAELMVSLQKVSTQTHTEDVTSQTDIELF